MPRATISGLFIYPIKSCAPIAVDELHCSPQFVKNDRSWVIVDSQANVLTQRTVPQMSRIQPRLGLNNSLYLSAPDMAEELVINDSAKAMEVARNAEPNIATISLWSDDCPAIDQGDQSANFLTEYLKQPCRLLAFDLSRENSSSEKSPHSLPQRFAFTDCCPISLIAEESVEYLNSLLSAPVLMSRFRPSIVVRGLAANHESDYDQFSNRKNRFPSIKPCARCVVVNVDQERGVMHPDEPLKTITRIRIPTSAAGKIHFGHYFAAEKQTILRISDELEFC